MSEGHYVRTARPVCLAHYAVSVGVPTKGPTRGSPSAPQSTCVTSATEGSATGSRAKAVPPGAYSVGWLPGVVGSLVCADAAGQGAEVAGGEFSLPVCVGPGDPIPLSGCGLSPLCRWQQADGEPDSLWDE